MQKILIKVSFLDPKLIRDNKKLFQRVTISKGEYFGKITNYIETVMSLKCKKAGRCARHPREIYTGRKTQVHKYCEVSKNKDNKLPSNFKNCTFKYAWYIQYMKFSMVSSYLGLQNTTGVFCLIALQALDKHRSINNFNLPTFLKSIWECMYYWKLRF